MAKTSVSTVSNFLNGRPERMRPETRRRIEDAMHRLGYRPSWAARQLKTGFVPVLGLLVPSVANPSHGAMARAVEEAAQARGFQVVLGNCLRDRAREQQYAQNFWDFGIRGLIVGSSPPDLNHLAELRSQGLAIVAFDLTATVGEDRPATDCVSVNNRLAGYLATRHLLELGHRRIGYLTGATPTVSRRERFAGYGDALAEAGMTVDERLVSRIAGEVGSDDTHAAEHGRLGARELLALRDAPTGLVALNDMRAIGACAAVRELGLSVPEDISVVGIDDIVLAGLFNPALTTVHQPTGQLCDAAVDLLVERLRGGAQAPPRHLTIDPHLVVRASAAPPRESRAT